MVELHRVYSKLGGRYCKTIVKNACIAGAEVSYRMRQNEA